jgi:hypothetical protein
MRIIGVMTFVCLLLLLAMLPALLQLARACGIHTPGAMSAAIAFVIVAGMLSKKG